jgi:protein SCO1/2
VNTGAGFQAGPGNERQGMTNITARIVAGLVSAAVFAAAAATAVAQQGPGGMRYAPGTATGERPNLLEDVRFDQQLGAKVPADVLFRDETGKAVRLADYLGKRPLVLALVYYECPMLCSQVLNGLVSSLGVLTFTAGNEFDVVAVSFNPREGPGLAEAKKRAYMERYDRPGSEPGWHFLTGPPESIAQLTEAVGFKYAWDDKIKQYAHAAGVIVLTPDGRVSKYFYGVEYSARDLKYGLMEASDQKIGSPVDNLLLYCYHYDPTTGKYGVATMTAVRIGGAATIFGLVAFWAVMWRRDHRAPGAAASRGA